MKKEQGQPKTVRETLREKIPEYNTALEYLQRFVPGERIVCFLMAYNLASWFRFGVYEAQLCFGIINGTIDETHPGVLNCVERIMCTIPGMQQFEHRLERELNLPTAFAMCLAALYLDVWRVAYFEEHKTETENTEHLICMLCNNWHISIE